MVENQEQERQYNGEDLVRINTEQTSAVDVLRNTINGLKRLPFFPKAVVIAFKEVPSRISQTFEKLVEDAQKLETQRTAVDNTNSGDQGAPATEKSQGDSTDEQKDKDQDGPSADSLPVDQRVINDAVAQAQAITDGAAPADSIVGSTNKTTQKDNSDADQNANTIGTKKISVIEAKNLRDLPGFLASLINSSEDNSKNSTDRVNSAAFPAATIATPEKGDASAVVSEDTDELAQLKAKLEESKKRYGDLMSFNTWDDYYEALKSSVRELTRKGESLLSSEDFDKIKLEQLQLSRSIAKASINELKTQADSLEKHINEVDGKMKENEDARDSYARLVATLVTDHNNLEEERSKTTADLKKVQNDIAAQANELESIERKIEQSSQQSSYIDQIVREETDKLTHQQGDTTATTFSGNESLDSPLVSGMNGMSVSQETTTGLLNEMDTFPNDRTSVSTEMSDTDEEVAPVTSEVIPQNGNDAWKTGNEALQKNENTGIDMGLTPLAKAEVERKAKELYADGYMPYPDVLNWARIEFDDENLDRYAKREQEINDDPNLSDEEKKKWKDALWAGFDNFVKENYVDSDAKGRTR